MSEDQEEGVKDVHFTVYILSEVFYPCPSVGQLRFGKSQVTTLRWGAFFHTNIEGGKGSRLPQSWTEKGNTLEEVNQIAGPLVGTESKRRQYNSLLGETVSMKDRLDKNFFIKGNKKGRNLIIT